MEARKGGEGGSAVRWCSAAAMAWAAAFQGAGSRGGAQFGVEQKGKEREREVAKQNGGGEGCRGELGRGGVKGGRTGVGGGSSRRRRRGVLALEHGHSEGRRALECGRGVNGREGRAWRGRAAGQRWRRGRRCELWWRGCRAGGRQRAASGRVRTRAG